MRKLYLQTLLLSLFLLPAGAAPVRGTVVDPSGAPIDGAQVSVMTPLGVSAATFSAPDGAFNFDAPERSTLVVAAPGFASKSIAAADAVPGLVVKLELAPVVDSVRVLGSAIDVAASQQGGGVTTIPREEIRRRNEPQAFDLLRTSPGLSFSQTGPTGGLSTLYIRGGNAGFSLVQIDGVPVNAFGGGFDFAHIPSESLDRVEVIRGPQSAVYGSYANSGVVNFITRAPGSAPDLDVTAEGGSHNERRFGVSGSGSLLGFGIAASASQLNTDGPVLNSDYRDQNLMLNVTRRWARQSLFLHGDFESNENGVPGPWGSDPMRTFTGIDTISRNKNNFSDYSAHYQVDVAPRLRQEFFGSYFQNNNGYASPYGFSMNKDLRGQAETRSIVSVSRHYVAAFGVSGGVEEIRNSYITDSAYSGFPIKRRDAAVYLENRFEFGNRLFINAGVRGEFIRTNSIPTDGWTRPFFPAQSIASVNPKVSAAYAWRQTRAHGSFGTGIRPPGGFDLAFTNNPALKPERTRSFDAGVEQTIFRGWLAVDVTYFHSRYSDLIVTLGGSLAKLSSYQSDNIANSRAEGAEFSVKFRPARWVFVDGSYTRLKTEILALDGAKALAPAPFAVGQELLRRPQDSGSFNATFTHGRATASLTGVVRGSVLDVEPAWGATNGLFRNSGYSNVGVNLNYYVGRGVTAYGNLRNALNSHYEEVLGYPSPRLNFVAGLKWSLSKAM
jgi:outer membrane cobalamin receptor